MGAGGPLDSARRPHRRSARSRLSLGLMRFAEQPAAASSHRGERRTRPSQDDACVTSAPSTMPGVEELPLRRRVARLGWLTLALTGLTLALLGIAVWLALTEPGTHGAGRLPVAAKDSLPSIALILAVGAAAAAMRVLARDRRIPAPLPPEARRLRSTVLAPLGHSTARLVDPPALPPSE